MEPLLKNWTLAQCLPRSQAYLKSALQPFAALPLFPAAFSACMNTGYRGKGKSGPHLLLILTGWNLTDSVCKLETIFNCVFACSFTLKLTREQANCTVGLQITEIQSWVIWRSVFALTLFFFWLRTLAGTLWKAPKKAFLTQIH